MLDLVTRLLATEADLVLTVTAPLDRQRPNNDQDRIKVRNQLTEASRRVLETGSSGATRSLLRHLDKAVGRIDLGAGALGFVIVATAEFAADVVPRDLRSVAGRFARQPAGDDREQWRTFYRDVDDALTAAIGDDPLPIVLAGVDVEMAVTTATTTRNSMREARSWPPAPHAIVDFHRRMPAYEPTVTCSSLEANERCLVISGTSWPGYEMTPAHVIDGYSTIFDEVDHAIDATGLSHPDVVVVPMGVGALMAATVSHYRGESRVPTIVAGVEPLDANCVQASAGAGVPTHVPGPHDSIMVGLNCGMPSPIAWPSLAAGVDWFVAVDDDAARQAMRDLADAAVVAGETGAAFLAGLRALLAGISATDELSDLSDKTALIVVTEAPPTRRHTGASSVATSTALGAW